MARTRTGSTEPGGRVRGISQTPSEATRVIRAQRHKSASPAPSTLARKTQFRRDQPTPVRPLVTAAQQQQQAGNNKVVKNTGRTGGKRAKSVDSEGRTSREGSTTSSSGRGNGWSGVEIEQVRQTLPRVPEGNEEAPVPDATRYIPSPKTQQRVPSEYSISLSPLSSPEPDVSGTQLEVEDMDVDLMLETFPDLDAYAKKLLDLLILDPPDENLLRDLRLPGSKSSKRLRLYEQSFTVSKSAYGTSKYLSAHYVEVALQGNKSFNPLLHKSNLAILATFACTAQEWGDGTFEELKEIERDFPSQFGDVVHEMNFQVALDLRTQTLVIGLMKNQDVENFDPDFYLRHFFMGTIDEDDPSNTQGSEVVKPWPGVKSIIGWKKKVLDRIMQIRSAFEEGDTDEAVDFDKLTKLFPWNEFVERISGYVKVRLTEIEKSREGKSVEDLVNYAKNPQSLEIVEEKPQSEILQEEPTEAIAPKDNAEVSYPKLAETEAQVEVGAETITLQEFDIIDDRKSLGIKQFKQPKRDQDKKDRERLDSPAIVFNAAQMRDLKRRKTVPVPQRIPEIQVVPRVATSLGAQEAVGISIAQVKFLKDRKLRIEPLKKQPEEHEAVAVAGPSQKAPVFAELWFGVLNKQNKIKNKENDKSVASIIPPSPQPPQRKRKRFIDPQEGATRVSQIEEDMPESPVKRQQVYKGKGKAQPRVEYEKEQDSRPNYDEEDDEEDDIFQQDQRKENEEKLKKSRRNLLNTSSASSSSSALIRVSNSSVQPREQPVARPEDRRRQIARSKDSRGSRGSKVDVSYEGRNEDEDDDDDSDSDSDSEGVDEGSDDEGDINQKRITLVSRVNRLARISQIRKPKAPRAPALPKTREPWGQAQTELLVKKIGEEGPKWAKIRDMRLHEFSGRSNIQLKDKARNIKYDFLRARIPLPHNFDQVTISRKQIDALRDMGINYDGGYD